MTPYNVLPGMMPGVLAGLFLLVMIVSILILVIVGMTHAERRYLVPAVLLTLLSLFVMQSINDIWSQPLTAPLAVLGKLPWMVFAAGLVGIAAAEGVLFFCFLQKRKSGLLPSAVKESLDAMPDGICYFTEEGQPLLVNSRMQQLSGELFGTEILNAAEFWRDLREGKLSGNARIISKDSAVTLQTEDGTVWDFHKNLLEGGSQQIWEMTAFNVTEQHRLGAELQKRNETLRQVNLRLRQYSRDVERVIADRELLTAKVQVHDDVGRALLAFRSGYLTQPEEKRQRGSLLRLWRTTIAVLKNEAVYEGEESDWELLQQAARAVDVDIERSGILPEKGQRREILMAAMHECLTNTVKHAQGSRMQVSLRYVKDLLTVKITNDGIQPKGPIQETGGLRNLRHRVEAAGGTMKVESSPQFALWILLRKGEEEQDG